MTKARIETSRGTEAGITPQMIEAGLAVLQDWQESSDSDDRAMMARLLSAALNCRADEDYISDRVDPSQRTILRVGDVSGTVSEVRGFRPIIHAKRNDAE